MTVKDHNVIDQYYFFGKVFYVSSPHKEVLNKIRVLWQPFYRKGRRLKPKAVFHIPAFSRSRLSQSIPRISNDNLLWWRSRQKFIRCDFTGNPWQVTIQYAAMPKVPNPAFLDPLTSDVLFLFRNALKRLGLICIHSGTVAKNGRGVLIPAVSGGGKTTTVLQLIRHNFKYISEDQVFLRENGRGIEALGYPSNLGLLDKSVSFFPELKFLEKTPYVQCGDRYKKSLGLKKLRELYPGCLAKKTQVKLLVFPKISRVRKARVEKISKPQALVQMLREDNWDYDAGMKDSVALKKQWELYSRLCQSVPAYRLYVGRMSAEIPKLISKLLSGDRD